MVSLQDWVRPVVARPVKMHLRHVCACDAVDVGGWNDMGGWLAVHVMWCICLVHFDVVAST